MTTFLPKALNALAFALYRKDLHYQRVKKFSCNCILAKLDFLDLDNWTEVI